MKSVYVAVMLVVLLTFTSACSTVNSQEDTLTIGAILSLTGPVSSMGEQARMGIDLAIEEINSQGGILGKQLRVIYEDDNSDDQKVALNALQNLQAKGVDIIVGPLSSGAGLALAPIACDKNTILFAPSIGMADFTEECGLTFSMWPDSKESSTYLADIVASYNHKRVAIIGSDQAWEFEQATTINNRLQELQIETLQIIHPNANDNYYAESAKIKEFEPDAIVFTNFMTQPQSAKSLREIGVESQFYSVGFDQSKIDAGQGAFEETITITIWTPTEEFKQKYESHYETVIDLPSDMAYDIVYLLAEAIESSQSTDPSDIAAQLHQLDTFNGASGDFSFNQYGAVSKNPILMKVVENKQVAIG